MRRYLFGGLVALVLCGGRAGAGAVPINGVQAVGAPARSTPGINLDFARIEPLDPAGSVRVQGAAPAGSAPAGSPPIPAAEYRGTLEVRRGPTGVAAVNEVGLEDYLKGIAEMPSSWPAEAQRAQAIAARTYVLWVLGRAPAGTAAALDAQVCATEACQVYAGLVKEQSPGGANWAAAVDATRGRVLLLQGAPILAKYSSSNGGRSVSGGRSYLRPVDDPDDAASPLHRWSLDVSFDDLARIFATPHPVTGARRDGGTLVLAWTAPDGAGGESTVPVPDVRTRLNGGLPAPAGRRQACPSSLWDLAVDGGARRVTLNGRGYGHGIGMSQYGAYGRAARGQKADAILAAYYGGIRPATLAPERVPERLRVAVDPGRPEVAFSASGPFRVRNGAGDVVVAVADGTWRARPGPRRGLTLLPPAGQSGPLTLDVVAITPASPLVGQPVTLRLHPSVPALLSVRGTPPGGTETLFVDGAPTSGEFDVALPPAARPGGYVLTVTGDAGGGRSVDFVLAPSVLPPPGAPTERWRPPDLASPDGPPGSALLRAAAADRPLARLAPPANRAGRGTGGLIAAAAALGLTGVVTVFARRRWWPGRTVDFRPAERRTNVHRMKPPV